MTDQQSHNGWTNYATWRVNLELFDGCSAADFCFNASTDRHDAALAVQHYAQEFIDSYGIESRIITGWLAAFLDDVNWQEIADHIIEQ